MWNINLMSQLDNYNAIEDLKRQTVFFNIICIFQHKHITSPWNSSAQCPNVQWVGELTSDRIRVTLLIDELGRWSRDAPFETQRNEFEGRELKNYVSTYSRHKFTVNLFCPRIQFKSVKLVLVHENSV